MLIFKDAASSDILPDTVLGQDSFWAGARARAGDASDGMVLTRTSVPSASPLAPGDLYVADTQNDRLLVFERPLRNARADRVFGHADFNTGGFPSDSYGVPPLPSPARLLRPTSLALDAQGNLYVADAGYNRVLAFDRP